MVIKSIRWRLQLWLAFLLLCLLSGFGLTTYQLNRVSRFSQLEEELERRLALVSTDVRGRFPPPPMFRPGERGQGPPREHFRGPDRLERPSFRDFEAVIRNVQLSPSTSSLFDESATNGFYYAIWSRDRDLLKGSTNAPADVIQPERVAGDTTPHIRARGEFREAYHYTELGECILVGRSATYELEALQRFAWVLMGVGAVVLGIGLGGAWLVATQALRPLDAISAAASRISSGNLSERIDIADTDGELGRLAGVLNSTFARLEAAFAQQRQFTANASHELRTPIAVLITEAQTALARERTAPEYRETIQACLQTAQQMRKLTETLMKLARFDAGQEVLESSSFDLKQITAACVEMVRPLADHQQLELRAELGEAMAIGDGDRMGQVITNLLSNAIQFNQPNGRIEIFTRMENGLATVEVRDTGQGISVEDLPRIFERFYRADKSRDRSNGHAGLGLAISKAIVEAQGGAITVKSEVGKGAAFRVQLPPAATCSVAKAGV